MIFFGTGQYMTENDPSSTGANTFYAIWDSGANITGDRDTSLVSQTSTVSSLTSNDVRLLSNNPVDYSEYRGWYYDLPDTGERVIYRPIVIGELVVYITLIPESNLCSTAGGYSWLMVHNLADGTEPDFIAIDVNGDSVFDSSDQVGDSNVAGVKTGSLAGPMTYVKSGANTGKILIPDDSYDPALGEFEIQHRRRVGSRSSWGRYRTE